MFYNILKRINYIYKMIFLIIYLIGVFFCTILGGMFFEGDPFWGAFGAIAMGAGCGLLWPILIIIFPIRRLVKDEWFWEE